MEINFRIVQTKTHQVLVEKDFDNEDEENVYLIRVSFFEKGVKASQNYGYSSEEKRNEYFLKISDELVQNIVDSSLKLFK